MDTDDLLDWLQLPDAARAHAFKSNGRAYCGHYSVSAAWLPAGPLTHHCGNCERLMALWAAKDGGTARER